MTSICEYPQRKRPIIIPIIKGRQYASLTYCSESKPIIVFNKISWTMRWNMSAIINSIIIHIHNFFARTFIKALCCTIWMKDFSRLRITLIISWSMTTELMQHYKHILVFRHDMIHIANYSSIHLLLDELKLLQQVYLLLTYLTLLNYHLVNF